MRKIVLTQLLILFCLSIRAKVQMPALFSDNMVLQQNSEAPIWGVAKPNKKVTIKTSWNDKKYETTADKDGKWSLKLKTISAGGPYYISISDGKEFRINNVMLGEVWVCSGQSNMEMPVNGWGKVNNYQNEMIEAQNYPNIRLLLIDKVTSPKPLNQVSVNGGGWKVCDSISIAEFSACAYFFGRDIHKSQNVAIGLIDVSWGGTIIEAWTSRETLSTMPDMVKNLECLDEMPLTKEEGMAKFENEVKKWEAEVSKRDKGFSGDIPIWSNPEWNDKYWKELQVPGYIQENGFQNFSGIFWYRKGIDIPKSWENKDLVINLAAIDDNDFTYFNGTLIGHTEGWLMGRTYTIPKNIVKSGKAVIAVRVMDTGGKGGIFGNEESVNIKCGDETIPLSGKWKGEVSMELTDVPSMPINTFGNANVPSVLFNAMLNPIIPYSIKGAIWYQGESNAYQAYQYRDLMAMMISDWREKWGYDFPFYMVQLANYTEKQTDSCESTWAELREAQTQSMHLKNVGMAVTIDIGEANDIHPKNKQEVGRRLALCARANDYGEKIRYSGPIYNSYSVEKSAVRIYFNNAEKGLKTKNGEKVVGFTIAGPDHKFYFADAKIDGNTIVVSSPNVNIPLAVRYAWADNPICNLYNDIDLPASPFRTDDWQGVTYGSKR